MKFCVDEKFTNYSGVYKIWSPFVEEIYIGSAINLYKRFKGHDASLASNTHRNIFLQRSFSKLSGNGFRFELLELVENEVDLIDREQFYIDAYPFEKLFNLCPTAGSSLGYKHTGETKEKLKYARLMPTRLKISESLKINSSINLPTGVFLNKSGLRYCSKITYKSKIYNLGTFDTAYEASLAYRAFADDPEEGVKQHELKKKERLSNKSSGFPGVCFHTRDKTWIAQIKRNGRYIFQKSFYTEKEENEARVNFLASTDK